MSIEPKTTIRFVSDLHLGIISESKENDFVLDSIGDESEQILVLAGDICDESCHGIYFLLNVCSRFKHVVYVFGNHEYYRQSIQGARDVLIENLGSQPENLHILDCDTFVIDNLMFIGATLWTDLDGHNTTTKHIVSHYLNDCRMISVDGYGSRFNSDFWYDLHNQHKDYIDIQCTLAKKRNLIPIVITHHAPSTLSVHKIFEDSDINGGFASDLTPLIEKQEMPIWFHGHMHHCFDYYIENTRVLCNPRGYFFEELQNDELLTFDPIKTVVI